MSELASLRIIHVVRQFHPGIGGIENFVEQLASRQAANGHRVRVVTLDRIFDDPVNERLPVQSEMDGVEIRRIPFRGSQRYPIAPWVLGHISDGDLVHVHAVDFFADYLAATAPLHRKPMVLTTHGGFFHTDFARILKKIYFRTVTRATLSQFAAVIACSAEDERTFRPIAGSRLTMIPNPVDVDKFAGLADPNGSTIIYFGRLAPNKQIEQLIEWFAGLANADQRWRLIIAGKPMGVDFRQLAKHATDLCLPGRVSLHESPSDVELRTLIGQSSVYISASSYEGFGLAAVEAASAGLFPVLSNIPPFINSIERLGFGMVVNFDDPSGWPASYECLSGSLEEFQFSFDLAKVRCAIRPFGWAGAISRFEEVYERVLGRTRRRIGQVAVDVMDRDKALCTVLGAAAVKKPLMVTFCNAHTVNLAQSNSRFAEALNQALVLNDGVGVDIASKALFGAPFPQNLNGTDFVPHLLASTERSIRVFLLGGRDGVAEAAGRAISKRFSLVTVAGTMHGYFDENEEPDLLRKIVAAKPDLILVALGQPRQEYWASRYWRELDCPCLCVGALLDFLAERVPRAPNFMRKMRMEWAFRLAQEPRRLASRYLIGNAVFLGRIVRQRLAGPRL